MSSEPVVVQPPTAHRLFAALAGLLAAALTLGVGHLVAALVAPAASPVLAVGSAFIDLTPEWLKSFAIATFGERDKDALLVGIAVVLGAGAGLIGLLAAWQLRPAIAAIAVLGLVGAAAAIGRPGATPIALLPSLVGSVAGSAALAALVRASRPRPDRDLPPPVMSPTRRRFLGAATVATVAAASGGAGVLLAERRRSEVAIASAQLPEPVDPAGALPAGVDLGVDGIPPFVTPNDRFYRVDTALQVPTIDPATWQLRVHGMVDRELVLSLDDLLQLPVVERDITLTCVSNVVGGELVGHARWTGVLLADVLGEAGVQPGASQIVSRSIDGMTIGTPTDVALDGRDALLAVGMNGEPLPPAHGAPVRMVVPGLYGYVSATKWLVDLELTTFDAYDAYWVQRGWDARAPILTSSRIDTPRPLAQLTAGRVAIGGVAWAQHRGIERVEVRVDDGPWTGADLGAVPSADTWRQWTLPWDATPGRHRIQVRATDGAGNLQTDERAEPFPNGSTGWHTVLVQVA